MNPEEWRTYLVTQESLSAGRSTLEVVEAAIDGGVDVVQLREKETSARWRYELGQEVCDLAAGTDVDVLVNDRVDIAQAVAADGVHLGSADLPVSVARELLGPDAIIGYSTADPAEARQAQEAGADYLGVGAVYGTDSKDVDDPKDGIGLEQVSAVAEAVDVPVIGIGGVTADNAASVREAGATGVAVISEITAADDPKAATAALCEGVTHD
ncbi:thiamine phosphate synthase [Natrialbaceae archaeon AArc-T1-2]|uniref:thiamine phosphate synthase n=1 Tax=Natrialbaceae archaeon AArc-T1-2 TaxID=3053904 RepID=UPI00255A7E97|nr:thiamine phosphate synthase [Natrialbaceae archaeon AArc-T1-2]WIV65866.1 thiamine phosphate synthase [Natrialbaceae archaeon AArc-T1-2]